MVSRWRQWARRLKAELHALYLVCFDPRVPRLVRWWVILVVGYAFSPIDLIPDPIPALGYLDDLLLVPAGIALALALIPPEVLADCRAQARARSESERPVNWYAAAVIVVIWIALAAGGAWLIGRWI